MTTSSPPSYTFLDPTPSPLLDTLASAPITPSTHEMTQPNNMAIPNAEPNTLYGPTPQGPTPTDLSPSSQSTLPTSIAITTPAAHLLRLIKPVAYLLIYLDDIILTASCPALHQQIIGSLNKEFEMTDLGVLNYFLGVFADHTFTSLFLSQNKYSLQLLECAYMVTCNPSRTPVDTESKLGPEGAPVGCPSTRSAKAVYRGVANVVVETAWLRNHLRELHSPLSTATLVYYDNVSVVYMSANPVQHQRMKHIEIDIHFVRDMVTAG
ncbi:ribonuclease H-like domain-containing protein [Tanacetum coccineum]